MTLSLRTIPGAAVRGTASGVFFMAIFGTLWAYTGVMGLQGWGEVLLLVVSVAIGIALCIGGGLLVRASRELTDHIYRTNVRLGKRTRLWFNLIFLTEGLAIAITIGICNATHHTELIPLVVAIIVGLHFFPMAPLFQVRLYHYTGSLLCLIAAITWLFIPEEIAIGGHQVLAYMSVVGLGSALVLWGTGLAIWLMGKRLLNDGPKPSKWRRV